MLLALSPAATATALGIRPDQVAQAVRDGLLPVHRIGAKTKIWVGDIEKWFRSFPAPAAKRIYRKRSKNAG
jgi:hypothetical protein